MNTKTMIKIKKEKKIAIKKIKSFLRRDNIKHTEINYISLFVDKFYNKKTYKAQDIKELLMELIFADIE